MVDFPYSVRSCRLHSKCGSSPSQTLSRIPSPWSGTLLQRRVWGIGKKKPSLAMLFLPLEIITFLKATFCLLAVTVRCFPGTTQHPSPKCWLSTEKSLFHWKPITTTPMSYHTLIRLSVSTCKGLGINLTIRLTLKYTQVPPPLLITWLNMNTRYFRCEIGASVEQKLFLKLCCFFVVLMLC